MRRRVLRILLLLSVSGMLVGCGELNATTKKDETTDVFEEWRRQEEERSNTISSTNSRHVYDYVDPKTGVHYLIYSAQSTLGGQGGITPRLNADGSLMVDELIRKGNSPGDDVMSNE